jgi:hypothetical protein
MNSKKLKYEMDSAVVNALLKVLNNTQVVGVQDAKNLLVIVEILKNPINTEEIEREQLETLKAKFEKSDKK